MADPEPQASDNKDNVAKLGQVNPDDISPETLPNGILEGGLNEINLKRIEPIECPKYLLMHPVLDRAIKKNANKVLKYGYSVMQKSEKPLAKEAADYCSKILERSDTNGTVFLFKMVLGAWGFGTSHALLVLNKRQTEVVKFEHQSEIFFGPAKWNEKEVKEQKKPTRYIGKYKIDPRTKKIAAYTQFTKKYPERREGNLRGNIFYDTKNNSNLKGEPTIELNPTGREIVADRVSKLFFDSIGDEDMGIPLAQWVQLTLTYLLNMERAGAQATVNFGFNKWVAHTPFKTTIKMKEFANSLSNINSESVAVMPQNVELKNIVPGSTDFDRVHPIYLTLVSIRTGIPKPLLVMDGTSTNKSTLDEQQEDQLDDIFNYQTIIEGMVEDAFFKACKVKFGKDVKSFEDLEDITPKFRFNESPMDIDNLVDRLQKESLIVRNYAISAEILQGLGLTESVAKIQERLKNIMTFNYFDKPDRQPNILAKTIGENTKKEVSLEKPNEQG